VIDLVEVVTWNTEVAITLCQIGFLLLESKDHNLKYFAKVVSEMCTLLFSDI